MFKVWIRPGTVFDWLTAAWPGVVCRPGEKGEGEIKGREREGGSSPSHWLHTQFFFLVSAHRTITLIYTVSLKHRDIWVKCVHFIVHLSWRDILLVNSYTVSPLMCIDLGSGMNQLLTNTNHSVMCKQATRSFVSTVRNHVLSLCFLPRFL